MMEPYIGEICQYPYSFAPKGWALCHGQLMPISQNQALFSLLGTTYGGDGRATFNLPDLRPRDAENNVLPIQVGEIYQGKPYMETSIALEGLYPQRD